MLPAMPGLQSCLSEFKSDPILLDCHNSHINSYIYIATTISTATTAATSVHRCYFCPYDTRQRSAVLMHKSDMTVKEKVSIACITSWIFP